MRVFLDANVLFSACLLPHGNAPLLVEMGRAGGCTLVTSGHALTETERNLSRKAPHGLSRMVQVLVAIQVVADPLTQDLLRWAELQGLPTKDAPILAAAVASGADLLVTGDRRHFGPLFGRTFRGARVVSLAEGLALVIAAAERPK